MHVTHLTGFTFQSHVRARQTFRKFVTSYVDFLISNDIITRCV